MAYMNIRLCALVATGLLAAGVPARAQTPAAEGAPALRGDVNGDGRVTREDAELVRAYLVRGTLPASLSILPAGDANADGRVTAADAALISRFAAGMDVSRFAVGRPVQPGATRVDSGLLTAEYQCMVDLEAGVQSCREVIPGVAGDARLDLNFGVGPLAFNSSWVHSRGSTVDEDTSTNTLTFTNNSGQTIGTSDGTNPDPNGNRLFFTTPPYVYSVYSGSPGSVTLETTDGTASFFTYGVKPYFQYDGLVALGGTSVSEPIRFRYPANTKQFAYSYRVSAAVRYEFVWTGGASTTSWTTGTNWLFGTAPTMTSDVTIPSAPLNQPVLAADQEINDLQVQTSATLGLGGFTLEVNGDVDASGTVSNGTLWMSGAGKLLKGNVDDVRITGGVSLQGATFTTGPVTVQDGALNVADQALTIELP